jgi:two-component system, OmpR family, sensor histidine kinase KdpD
MTMRGWVAEARPHLAPIVVGAASLALATIVALALEAWFAVADASPVYLLAVVLMAGRYGTVAAVATSFVAFLLYDLLFIEPRFTFAVADPQDWLSLLLFLVVGVVIGRLAGMQAERAAEAEARAGEAEVSFRISRSLAVAASVRAAAAGMTEPLRAATGMERLWIAAGPTTQQERVLADSAPGPLPPQARIAWQLHPTADPDVSDWIRTHSVGAPPGQGTESQVFRVPIEVDGRAGGSIWAVRDRRGGLPDRGGTRLLASAADQLGLALRRERLAEEATSAEVARRSDALKSALLDSVSHDLRTPLATIRAEAGGLMDPDLVPSTEAVRSAAGEIDVQAAHLSETVRDLLDLGRIEAGELSARIEVHDLGQLVGSVITRQHATLAGHRQDVDLPVDLPPVAVDAIFFDHALGNVLENAVQHGGPAVSIRIAAARNDENGHVDLLVDDDGPGVGGGDTARIFEKFRRGRPRGDRARGLGIGLSVARGMTEAMGGSIDAEPSPMGGLRIRMRLPAAPMEARETAADGPGLAGGS